MVWTTIGDGVHEYHTVMERDIVPPENIEAPAFTVADLLGMLPAEINGHFMVIRAYGKCWFEIRYEHIEIIDGQKCVSVMSNKGGSTILNAAYNMMVSYTDSKKQGR